jgi:hypothetical protein
LARPSNEAIYEIAGIILREAERLAEERRACLVCHQPLPLRGRGRPPLYCGPVCRDHAERERAEARAEARAAKRAAG